MRAAAADILGVRTSANRQVGIAAPEHGRGRRGQSVMASVTACRRPDRPDRPSRPGVIALCLSEGESLLEQLLRHDVDLPHECEATGACGTCVIMVREGIESLAPPDEDERDVLDKAGALDPAARLACRATANAAGLALEIERDHTPRAGAAQRAVTLPVSLSQRAATHIARQLAKRGAAAARLAVRAAGCSGFRYQVEYADRLEVRDTVFESRGIRIAVDPESLPFVHGTVLDLVQEGLSRRLRFDNPNARQTCGCGESFAA